MSEELQMKVIGLRTLIAELQDDIEEAEITPNADEILIAYFDVGEAALGFAKKLLHKLG